MNLIQYKTPKPEKMPNDIVTEDSAALQFIDLHCNDLRYCFTAGSWFRWTDVCWSKDQTNSAFQWAREFARRLSENQAERQRYTTNKTTFASGVERFAKGDPRVAVTIDYWDNDPWLLGTPGGTVDLTTGELRDSRPEDGITKLTSVAPIKGECPLWIKFLIEATAGDEELITLLQQWCGYCLTGNTREHALIFIHGGGGNGKSAFLNILTSIMKDYATTAPMETFTAARGERHPTEIAMLHGARLVTASETEEGRAWAESRIKQMTGGDPITARFMRQDNFTFIPKFKLLIVGNHKPRLNNVDEAARRRFRIVPFVHKPASPDRDLERKLMQEAPAILQWMIEGCLDWQANGLIRPASVEAATDKYFSDQDLLGQWIEDCCDVRRISAPSVVWDRSADLFDSWAAYAQQAGEKAGSKKAFGQALNQRGFDSYREPGLGTRGYRGLRLKITGGDAMT